MKQNTQTTANTNSKEYMKKEGVISVSPENGFITLTIDNYQTLLDSNRELLEALELLLKSHFRLNTNSVFNDEVENIAQTAINNAKNLNK